MTVITPKSLVILVDADVFLPVRQQKELSAPEPLAMSLPIAGTML